MTESHDTQPGPGHEQIEQMVARKDSAGLRDLLQGKPDVATTKAIISAIASIKTRNATRTLVELLAHGDFYTRQQAATALEHEKWKPGSIAERCAFFLAKEDDDALVGIGEAAIPYLIKALDNEPVPQYGCIRGPDVEVKALIKIGKPAVLPMVKALQGGSLNARRKVAGAFNVLADERAMDALERAASDADKELASLAVSAVGNFHEPRATGILIKALANRDLDIRSMAMRGLAWGKEASAVAPLIGLLDDPDRVVRWKAADALAEIGSPRAAPVLAKLADGDDKELAKRAVAALGSTGDASVVGLLGSKARDSDEFIRRAAVESSRADQAPAGVPVLAKAIGDPDKFVRLAAAEAIAAIAAPGAARMLDAAIEKEPVDYISDAMKKARGRLN